MKDLQRTTIKKSDFVFHTDALLKALKEHKSRTLLIAQKHKQAEQFTTELKTFSESIEYHYSSLILKTARSLSKVDMQLYERAMTEANQILFNQ